MKTALVTGASSGIGREIAYLLAKKGYNLILAARRKDELIETAAFAHKKYKVQAVVKICDLSDIARVKDLYRQVKPYNIDILVNAAGWARADEFYASDLDADLFTLYTNVQAVHILMKLFLADMRYRPDTYILNIAVSEDLPKDGPSMPAFYASKAYVESLSLNVAKELKESGSPTSVSVLCPGPVDTDFFKKAGGIIDDDMITATSCAKKAIKGMFRKKPLIKAEAPLSLSMFFVRNKVERQKN